MITLVVSLTCLEPKPLVDRKDIEDNTQESWREP